MMERQESNAPQESGDCNWSLHLLRVDRPTETLRIQASERVQGALASEGCTQATRDCTGCSETICG